jgi:thiamine biosynthesis lipoprotein
MRHLSKLNNKLPKLSPDETVYQFVFEAIGTHWIIDIYDSVVATQQSQLEEKIQARIALFDISYSRFREDSLVATIAQSAGNYDLPEDGVELFGFYKKLYDLSDGLVTPVIGQLLEDAGYDANYSLTPKTLRAVPSWDDTLQIAGRSLTTKRVVTLDFGAAGKGYLVDIIGRLLEAQDCKAYCINAGGDIRFRHPTKSLAVGLEHPDDPSLAIGVVNIHNQSICASASNRRAWRDLHHIMHPQALSSVDTVKATWVVAPTTIVADGIATLLFFMSPKDILGLGSFEYALIENDNSQLQTIYSDFFKGQLF